MKLYRGSKPQKKNNGRQPITDNQQKIAQDFKLDANDPFIHLIRQESGGQQFRNGKTIESSKGALGAAQVMPTTAPEAARDAGLPFDEHAYRNDMSYNTTIGKAYFAKMLHKFNGNLEYAAAAYNAGPGAVQRAITEGGANWKSQLPAETKHYIQKTVQPGRTQLSPDELRNYVVTAAPGYAKQAKIVGS